mmetsp:Transcript_36506/g.103883  ORF Transcript_36506/g.103883 Transcript_36506/m.103883 type:complete len:289 (+) Transcript_36506:488-1354(+)
MVTVWSDTVFWNSKFSAFLSSVARCKSICACSIAMWASEISCSKVLMVEVSSPMFASMSAFLSSVLAVVISLSWTSALHQSFFLTSSSCCCFSMTTISSIAALTFVKASNSTDEAKTDKSKLPVLRPACRSNAATRWRRLLWRPAEICTKLKVPLMASRASSPWRISIVSATAFISSKRATLRSSKSEEPFAHRSLRLFRKVWSSSRTFCSLSRSSFASAKVLSMFASSSSFCSSIFSASLICVVFAARSWAKAAPLACSIFCSSDRSPCISSSNCFSTPKISPLLDV